MIRPRLLTPFIAAVAAHLASAGPISVSELHYNPPGNGDEEFIELINTSASAYNLAGCQFTTGITYTFGNLVLQPGQHLVLCRDRTRFTSRYGSIPNLAPSTFSGRLADEGETLVLLAANGSELVRMQYRPDGPWPSRANGQGSSLESIDPDGNLSSATNWRASTEYYGSPGRAGIDPLRQVVINEILAHTDPPFEDAIELHNLTAQPIDIGRWYLSSPESQPLRYRIPAGTVIAPGGFQVFYQYQFGSPTPAPGDEPFALNSALGDEVVLLSTDASGAPRFWMDTVRFGPTGNGVSLGRFPDGTGPLVAQSMPTLGSDVRADDPPQRLLEFRNGSGASNAYPRVGPIVFNRIQYRPASGNDEFLELLNITDFQVPLYDPFHSQNTWKIGDGIDFTFPPFILTRPGEKFLVVPIDPALFRSKYSIAESTRIFGPYTNALSNTGERIALFKPDPPQAPTSPNPGLVPYILVEAITYSASAPWPTGADGTGAALLRRDPHAYSDDPQAWTLDRLEALPNLSANWNGIVLTLHWPAVGDGPVVLEESSSFSQGWITLAQFPAGTGSTPVPVTASPRWFRLRRP